MQSVRLLRPPRAPPRSSIVLLSSGPGTAERCNRFVSARAETGPGAGFRGQAVWSSGTYTALGSPRSPPPRSHLVDRELFQWCEFRATETAQLYQPHSIDLGALCRESNSRPCAALTPHFGRPRHPAGNRSSLNLSRYTRTADPRSGPPYSPFEADGRAPGVPRRTIP